MARGVSLDHSLFIQSMSIIIFSVTSSPGVLSGMHRSLVRLASLDPKDITP